MMNEYAEIIEIERFALRDGPGIRTVVFLRGCPLHCPWCANPESQGRKPLLMYYPKKCRHCGRCAASCPEKVIRFVEGQVVFLRRDCSDCEVCIDVCLNDAVKRVGVRMTVDEIMDTILRDKDYYSDSGGGVTFSGGEAMASPDTLLPLLKSCADDNLHTAVETCGNVPTEHFQGIIPYVNMFLFDIKHLDARRLKERTGGDLGLILRNLRLIAESGDCEIRLRVPCIPDFNLDRDFFRDVFGLAKSLGIKQIDLLPYHTLGKDKYTQLGLGYHCPDKALTKNDLLGFKQAGESEGLTVTFG